MLRWELCVVGAFQVGSALGQVVGVRLLTEVLTPSVFGEASLLMGVAALMTSTLVNPSLQALFGRSKRHVLSSSEVYYFIAGKGRLTVDSETRSVQAGSVVYVPPGGNQWLENTGNDELEFLCLVDPAWRIEDETILE